MDKSFRNKGMAGLVDAVFVFLTITLIPDHWSGLARKVYPGLSAPIRLFSCRSSLLESLSNSFTFILFCAGSRQARWHGGLAGRRGCK